MNNERCDTKPIYRSEVVWAYPVPLGSYQKRKVVIGTETVRKKKGLFSGEMVDIEQDVVETKSEFVPNGEFSETEIDLQRLASDIAAYSNDLDAEGYEVIQIISGVRGNFGNGVKGGQLYGYGYSKTQGVVLVARRRPSREEFT